MTDLFALFSKLVTPKGDILVPGIQEQVRLPFPSPFRSLPSRCADNSTLLDPRPHRRRARPLRSDRHHQRRFRSGRGLKDAHLGRQDSQLDREDEGAEFVDSWD